MKKQSLIRFFLSLFVFGLASSSVEAQQKPTDSLVRAIRAVKGPRLANFFDRIQYKFAEIDLDSDGSKEAIVFTNGPDCGAWLCPVYIFQKQGDNYRLLDSKQIFASGGISVLSSTTNGWRDIAFRIPKTGTLPLQVNWVKAKFDGTSYQLVGLMVPEPNVNIFGNQSNTGILLSQSGVADPTVTANRPSVARPNTMAGQQRINSGATGGGEKSLLVAANSPSVVGTSIEPGRRQEFKELKWNSATSIVIDRFNSGKLRNRATIYSFDLYNLGYANAVIEVFDARKKLIEVRGVDAVKNPTNVLGFPVVSVERLYKLSTEGYGFNDPRNASGQSVKTEIRNMVVPHGGYFKITKSGDNALRYNQVNFVMYMLLDAGLPVAFSNNPSLKVRLSSAIFFKLQQKRVGSLVRDGAFVTPTDTAKAFVNGNWIKEENVADLVRIGLETLEEELPRYALEKAAEDQILKQAERLVTKRLTFWIDAAETFAKSGNVLLQWLDFDRSQVAERQRGSIIISPSNN